jgi:hypothetical protein
MIPDMPSAFPMTLRDQSQELHKPYRALFLKACRAEWYERSLVETNATGIKKKVARYSAGASEGQGQRDQAPSRQ